MAVERNLGVPSEILLVGQAAVGAYYRLLTNTAGELQVDVTDRALRDLGIVDAQIAGGSSIAHGQVSVTGAATLIVAARTGRLNVELVLHGDVAVYVGAAGVTTATGQLMTGVTGVGKLIATAAAVYGITTGGTVTVSYLENY